MDEFSSCSLGAYKEMDYVPSDVENTQEGTNTTAAMSNIQDDVQADDELSDESEDYVIEKIDFSHPKDLPSDALREDVHLTRDNSRSFKSDEQNETNPKVVNVSDVFSDTGNNTGWLRSKDHSNTLKRSRIPFPPTPLEDALNKLVISDSTIIPSSDVYKKGM